MENKNNLILNRQNLIVPLRLKERLPRILVDQDDVLAMFLGRLVKEYNRRFGTQYTVEDCKQWNLEKTFGKQVWDIVLEKDFSQPETCTRGIGNFRTPVYQWAL